MPGWIGPVVALSLLVIAAALAIMTTMVFVTLKEIRDRAEGVAKEVSRLRADLAPTLDAVKRLGEQGLDVVGLAREEALEIIEATRHVRYDIERGVLQAKRRLADFDAVVEVVQDEIESTALDLPTAMQTARSGAGMIAQLRRLVLPRRRGEE